MLRGLLGVFVGLGYGVLVGAVMFLLDRISRDSAYPGVLMFDQNKIAKFLILLAMIVTGSAGALVGLLVALLAVGRFKAGVIGFCIGLLVLAMVLLKSWPQLGVPANASWHIFSFFFLFFLVLVMMLPVGLAATGVAASVVAGKLASTG